MTLGQSLGKWMNVFDRHELAIVLDNLNKLYRSKLVCPKAENVFRAFQLCDYDSCKVIFIGQDPYPQKGVATGILFGNNITDTSKVSPSLQIIKDACCKSTDRFDYSLEDWAKHGILLINSALTVEQDKVGSHSLLWRPFISKFLDEYSSTEPGQIYVLFGKQAQSFRPYIHEKFHDIIEVEHPSYFARTKQDMPKEVFEKINELLINKYGIPIEWNTNYLYEEIF